jgi:hypothetical protein
MARFPWLRLANVLLFAVAFALAIERQAWIGAAVIGIFLVLAIVILTVGVLQRREL